MIVGWLLVAPWLSPAVAGDKRDVRALFDQWVALGHAFDPSVGALYAPDALVHTTRTRADGTQQRMSFTGTQFQALLVQVMPEARAAEDHDRFDDVAFTREGPRWRITATRHNGLKCYDDTDFYQVVAPAPSGGWWIVEEYLGTQELSRCADAGSPLDQVLALHQQSLSGRLPLRIDDNTTLVETTVSGLALTYHMASPTYRAADLDVDLFLDTVGSQLAPMACGNADNRLLLDLGATLAIAMVDREGAPLGTAQVDVSDCLSAGADPPGEARP